MTHAQTRARDRYGVAPRLRDLARMAQAIESRSAEAVPLQRPDGNRRRAKYAVRHGDGWMLAVYDHDQKTIVTFLSPQTLKDHAAKLRQAEAALAERGP